MVVLLVAISLRAISDYFMCLLVVILLTTISDYSISVYWWLFYCKLLLVILG
jgi:hypothetical protein